ncbi:MAG: MBOAT family O-acyltransferase, partial [Candidatus Marinimicrobia bacterium]|nr:MBOAT family O-acyltransferase [Candidatus Neomarinimicrobiota bacterium]
ANKNRTIQNLITVCASYIFYCWWDWRFLSLIIISTATDYVIGYKLGAEENSKKRKILFLISICVNIGLLGFFKYYDFFIENFIYAFTFFGSPIQANTLNIILPVGISFYTFQTLSYTIDVYKNELKPTKDFLAFSAFVSFFPQLVAGPIERAKNLLPQFYEKRQFNYYQAVDGVKQVLWGLFKKMVIADNCAIFVNEIFNNSSDLSGSTLLIGAIFFAFQIYGDFSGYSDIAIGIAKLFGINLMQNFAFPYFSRDIAEFWRRWHISLSSWFRDYLYIPIGGSRGSKLIKIRNIFAIFLISGFWHGANWTFVAWGAINAIYFLPLFLTSRNRNNLDVVAAQTKLPSLNELISILSTFTLTVLAWVFFRAENINHALSYINGIFSYSLFSIPDFHQNMDALILLILIGGFIIIEWLGRRDKYAIESLLNYMPIYVQWVIYYLLIILIFLFTPTTQSPFIYFQF